MLTVEQNFLLRYLDRDKLRRRIAEFHRIMDRCAYAEEWWEEVETLEALLDYYEEKEGLR